MKKSPVCFIAMAFGWEDTDAFYEKQILPTLKRNGIKPVIINRHQSNDDLNFQIFEQLDKADFCIADLTYTRPSVYFEAGYAQRSIPVIYTVREDHLKKGQPEDLRVHFDLQMKPIIKWLDSSDGTFSKRLEDRIKATFLKDWNKKQTDYLKYQKDEKEFQDLSGVEKLRVVRYEAILALTKLGYVKSSWTENKSFNPYSYYYDKDSIMKGSVNYIYSYKANTKDSSIVAVQSFLNPSKKELIKLEEKYTGLYSLPGDILELFGVPKRKEIRIYIVTITLNPLPASRIESALPFLMPIESSKIYYENMTDDSPEIYSKFYFISGVKSLPTLRERLTEVSSNIKNS